MHDQVLTFNKRGNIRLNVTVRHVRETIFAVEKQYYYIFRVCVYSFSCSACKALAPSYTIFSRGLSDCTIFFNIISETAWLLGGKNIYVKCVLIFSTTFV